MVRGKTEEIPLCLFKLYFLVIGQERKNFAGNEALNLLGSKIEENIVLYYNVGKRTALMETDDLERAGRFLARLEEAEQQVMKKYVSAVLFADTTFPFIAAITFYGAISF